jgi:hypothetical protein
LIRPIERKRKEKRKRSDKLEKQILKTCYTVLIKEEEEEEEE